VAEYRLVSYRDAAAANECGDAVAKQNIIVKELLGVAQEEEEWMALVNRRV